MSWSIRARLTLWYGVVMALALTLFSASVLWLHARWGSATFDSELTDAGLAVSRVLQEEIGETRSLERGIGEAHTSLDVPGRAVGVLDLAGRPLGAEWRGFPYNESMALDAQAAPRIWTVAGNGHAWRVVLRRHPSPVGDYLILVAGALDPLDRQRQLLARVVFVATPLIVMLTAAVSWWVASSALRPLTNMAAQAEAITARSPDWRLETSAGTDEVGQFARAFNGLLNRLGTASQKQRQFMADASHELRTPVSVIRTAAEVTLQREGRQDWEYREALTIVQDQSRRLGRMVEDMLVLARADAGGYRLTRRALYVDEVAAECVRAASVVASVRDVRLDTRIQSDLGIIGDDGLLRQLLMNVLDNAVQYTPAGGAVTVEVTSDTASAIVGVSDTGPGIPSADRERVFDRFVRLDPARSSTSGAGLGLPIARWIAEQHGGTLTLEPNVDGGCRFVVRLPLAREATG